MDEIDRDVTIILEALSIPRKLFTKDWHSGVSICIITFSLMINRMHQLLKIIIFSRICFKMIKFSNCTK